MTIAALLIALIATPSAESGGDPVLLDFHSRSCGALPADAPEVEKLVQKGYPSSMNIDRSPELSDRYQVKAVPTFVIVNSKGKALAKTWARCPRPQARDIL